MLADIAKMVNLPLIHKSIRCAKRNAISVKHNHLIGFPRETRWDMIRTIPSCAVDVRYRGWPRRRTKQKTSRSSSRGRTVQYPQRRLPMALVRLGELGQDRSLVQLALCFLVSLIHCLHGFSPGLRAHHPTTVPKTRYIAPFGNILGDWIRQLARLRRIRYPYRA